MVFCRTEPKSRVVGLMDRTPAVAPVPLKDADGEPPGLAATVKLALRFPATVGRKVTCTVQVAFGASVAVHVSLEMLKSPALVPPREAAGIPLETPPVLRMVNEVAALVVLRVTEPKVADVGVIVSEAGPRPVPLSVAAAVPPIVAVTEREAVLAPADEG